MAEIIFKGGSIQRGYRIKVPKAIVDTLNLKEKEKIIIKFNPVTKKIIIEEDMARKK
jgi:bifunctional DNA-binding transcriptional regulator/antitoxin component of YhaV-PrlF toxin-antitoxin module